MRLSQKEISDFQQYIFNWWESNKRDLPWRHTNDPYSVLVSEVMLQQTQVRRVCAKYIEFIEKFPTVHNLSRAPLADVLIAWKGMGYNRRALYLHQTARVIVDTYHGVFPSDEKLLMKLPGLGIYTARALLVFAFKKNIAMVDTNIRQIITHFFFRDSVQKPSVIQNVADQIVPRGMSWEWHQALMDFSAIELKKNNSLRRRDVLNSASRAHKISIPFKDTARFIRGKIVDELRITSVNYGALIAKLAEKYDKPHGFIQHQIDNLSKEGLVSVLPDESIRLAD